MAYVVAKLSALIASPTNLLPLVVAILAWTSVSSARLAIRIAARAVCALFLLCGFAPVGALLLLPLENRFPATSPARVDRIVVLGGGLDPETSLARGQFALGSAGGRLTEAVLLARRFPTARLLLSGGNARLSGGGPAESTAARDLLIGLGVEAARIDVEDSSRTTYENALHTKAHLPDAHGTVLLVTSAAHMPRAVGAFRAVGVDVAPWPCAYVTSGTLSAALSSWGDFAQGFQTTAAALHEWGGLLVYRLRGMSSEFLPGPNAPR